MLIDTSNTLVHESKQVDKLIFNNLDFCGNFVSIGVLDSAYFNGMNLANDVFVLTDGPFSGIQYESIKIITFNFGDRVDSITLNNTTQHVMNLGGSSDTLNIKSLSGPLVVNGKDGNNTVTVLSDSAKLELIDALITFDGGDDAGDVLILNNTGRGCIDKNKNKKKSQKLKFEVGIL